MRAKTTHDYLHYKHLIKHWFSAQTFVLKIATFAKPENVSGKHGDQRGLAGRFGVFERYCFPFPRFFKFHDPIR